MDSEIPRRARGPALAHMGAVLVERHRFRSPSVDFRTLASDLRIPRVRAVGLRFNIKTANQLEREAGALFGGKTKDLGRNVGGRQG
jgi:hypothetical protein